MIKKLLSIAFFALVANAASAQCTPNPAYADSAFGVWPDTTENLPVACATFDYNAVIDIKTLTDSTLVISGSPVQFFIEAFRINSVSGLPNGFTYIPNQAVWVNGGLAAPFTPVQGCVNIVADASSVNTIIQNSPNGEDFSLTVVVDAKIKSTDNDGYNTVLAFAPEDSRWLSALGSLLPNLGVSALNVTGYKIRVRPSSDPLCASAGVAELIEPVSAKGNFPNPFNKTTNIQFNSDASKMVNLSVANMVGKVVYTSKIQANKGENTVNFTAEQLSPGVYFYTISDGKNSVTRRMVVASN